MLDTASGSHALGPVTVDSDADGTPDTAVLVLGGPAAEELVLATDLDADQHADVVTTIDAAGGTRTDETGPDGRFATDPTLPAPGPAPPPDPGWETGWDTGRPGPWIDPATGAWTRGPGV